LPAIRISRRYRHMMRLRAILGVFARHGFGYFIDLAGLSRLVPERLRASGKTEKTPPGRGKRLRKALEELGPTFVKLGQMLSSRADLLPPDIILELSRLRDEVAPFPAEEARKILEGELNRPMDQVFSWFSEDPIAAASIGQVHRARLLDGSEVVVKVQRPGIKRQIHTDMEILRDLARALTENASWARFYDLSAMDLSAMVEEFRESMERETDYLIEAKNAQKLRENHKQDDFVRVPSVYRNLTTSKVLTLEYIQAPNINQISALDAEGIDRKVAAINLGRTILKEIMIDGFFHADPHPGNVSVLSGNIIFLMDFGMVGSLSASDRGYLCDLLLCLVREDLSGMAKTLLRMGVVPSGVDTGSLIEDMETIKDKYYGLPLENIKVGETIREILDVAHRHGLRIPPQFTMAARALITLEGTVELLDPGVSVLEIARPFGKELVREKMKPGRLLKKAVGLAGDIGEELREFPFLTGKILRKLEEGRIQVRMEHVGLPEALSRLDKIANKIVFSIALLGFSIVIAALIVGYSLGTSAVTGRFARVPLLELALVVAALMVGYLMLAIFRSGRF